MKIRIEGEITLEKLASALQTARTQFGPDAALVDGTLYLSVRGKYGVDLEKREGDSAAHITVPACPKEKPARRRVAAPPSPDIADASVDVKLLKAVAVALHIHVDRYTLEPLHKMIDEIWQADAPVIKTGARAGSKWAAPTIQFMSTGPLFRCGPLRVPFAGLLTDTVWPRVFRCQAWGRVVVALCETFAESMTSEDRATYYRAVDILAAAHHVRPPRRVR